MDVRIGISLCFVRKHFRQTDWAFRGAGGWAKPAFSTVECEVGLNRGINRRLKKTKASSVRYQRCSAALAFRLPALVRTYASDTG